MWEVVQQKRDNHTAHLNGTAVNATGATVGQHFIACLCLLSNKTVSQDLNTRNVIFFSLSRIICPTSEKLFCSKVCAEVYCTSGNCEVCVTSMISWGPFSPSRSLYSKCWWLVIVAMGKTMLVLRGSSFVVKEKQFQQFCIFHYTQAWDALLETEINYHLLYSASNITGNWKVSRSLYKSPIASNMDVVEISIGGWPSPSSSLSHSSLLLTCFTSSLEPAPYITQNSSSELLTPLSATFIWTCWFILLHTAIRCTDISDLRHFRPKTFLHCPLHISAPPWKSETLRHQCRSVLGISAPLINRLMTHISVLVIYYITKFFV